MVFAILWFDMTHTDKHTQDTEGPIDLLIQKFTLPKLKTVFAFQKLLTCRTHISAD